MNGLRVWALQKLKAQIMPAQVDVLRGIVGGLDPHGLIVELGTYKGGSAAMFSVINPQIRILTIDAIEGAVDYWDPQTYPPGHNIREGKEVASGILPENLARGRIFQVIGLSEDVAQTFNWEIDFLFVDGHWKYEPTKADLESWAGFVKPGGWIVGHHYGGEAHAGARQAVDEWIAKQADFYWVGEMERMAVMRRGVRL